MYVLRDLMHLSCRSVRTMNERFNMERVMISFARAGEAISRHGRRAQGATSRRKLLLEAWGPNLTVFKEISNRPSYEAFRRDSIIITIMD